VEDQDWAACVLAWDEVLRSYPDYGEGYYYRSMCYLGLLDNQRVMADYEAYLSHALEDIDRAIALGESVTGDYYYLRYRAYDDMAVNRATVTERLAAFGLALENLQRALALGTGSPLAHRSLPACLIAAGHCQEGLSEAQRLLDAIRPGDSPSASINEALARAYLCLGDYQRGLDRIRAALSIREFVQWRYTEAMLLYGLGREDEAARILDQLIEDDPYFAGYRFYFRALIHYDQGRPDLAEEDLWTGAGNTWGYGGAGSIVAGLLARDAGRLDEAIDEFTWALESMDNLDGPFIKRALSELRALGVEPTMQPAFPAFATPLPVITPVPSGEILATPVALVRDYGEGSGRIRLGPEGYQAVRFQSPPGFEVAAALRLRIVLELLPSGVPPDINLFIWQPHTNIWTMYDYLGGPIEVADPDRFVLPDGGLVLAAYNSACCDSIIEGLSVSFEVRLSNGSVLTLGEP